MGVCIKCGKTAEGENFRVLEVRTLHVRDVTGEKRVQALGDFREFFVCADCARQRLEEIRKPGKTLWKKLAVFLSILVLGIVLTILFWKGEGALRLMGLGAIVCGILGVYGTYSAFASRQREFASCSEAEALHKAAWLCLTESAPQKENENDLTYIPVDKQTLARKNGDLMVLYDLLPQIAIEAYARLHEK